jgi:hypothetical protein
MFLANSNVWYWPIAAFRAMQSPMNKELDQRGRYDAVMAAEGLFQVEPIH